MKKKEKKGPKFFPKDEVDKSLQYISAVSMFTFCSARYLIVGFL